MKQPAIEIIDVRKKYPDAPFYSLKGVNLTINTQEKYGILGPNGAGKTTLISILCRVLEPSEGDVRYFSGEKEILPPEFQTKLGYVPQEYAFYEELTPIQNLDFFGAMYGVGRKEIRSRALSVLDRIGLSDVAHKKVNSFSGGMKRKVNLAIGIIHNPEVLILDEPTVGVDIQSKISILSFLDELNRSGTTIIYTSHHLDEAQEFCTRIAFLDQGNIVDEGATNELLAKHNASTLKELFITLSGNPIH
tara:strand:- start:1359 stop:2102 length:744 start_codon:yes stop_codon:yes gene_type:complete